MNVHRTRFVDYTPAAITSIAFSHRSNPGDHHSQNLRCAVGRANGDIEIWNPRDNWTHDITLKGGQGRSVEGLTWVTQKGHSPRLFSIGSSTLVTEWSLDLLRPKISLDCHAGAIWSIAVAPDGETLAMGCEDGSLVIADVSGGPGSLEYKHVLTRQKSRILSLAFSGQDTIVGGCSDSTVKVWDCRTARGPILARMTVDRVRNEPTLVWSVLVLRNGTIVSGDSTGAVKFWDKKFYSLLQNFKLHQADVLCLGMNAAGDTLFSAGIDRKMQMYQSIDNNKRKWAHVSGRRFHAHDVRAMTSYESRGMSSVVTGGVDMSLAIIPLKDPVKTNHRMIPAVPQQTRCHVAREARLVMLWTDRQVKIWRLCENVEMALEPHQQLVSVMTFSNEENLTAAVLSDDGKYLVVSSLVESKLYMLLPSQTTSALRPVKIVNEQLAVTGARSLLFVQDASLLIMTTPESDIKVFDLTQSPVDESDLFDLILSERLHIELHATAEDTKKNQTYLKTISHLALLDDGSLLAAGSQNNIVKIFDTQSGILRMTLPSLPSRITAMAFHGTKYLVLTTANMQIHEFDISTGQLSGWSTRNAHLLPPRFTRLHDHCLRIRIDAQHRAWMFGANWVSYINLSQDLPPPGKAQAKRKRESLTNGSAGGLHLNGSRRNIDQAEMPDVTQAQDEQDDKDGDNEDEDEEDDVGDDDDDEEETGHGELEEVKQGGYRGKFWITFKYRSLLLFDVLSESELLVVERPLMDMLNNGDIPPPFFVKRYGQA